MPVTAEDAMQDQKASQGHADSQQLLAEAHGMRSGEVNLIFDIMKALCGEHAVVQTSAFMETCWSEKLLLYQGQADLL